mgnify:CR=1 FL=1
MDCEILSNRTNLGAVLLHLEPHHWDYVFDSLQYRTGAGVADDDVRRAHLFRYGRREAEPVSTAP